MEFSSKNCIFVERFVFKFVCFKYICKEILKFYTTLAKVKTLGKTITDERLIIRRRAVFFRVDISRLADEFIRLILVKQPAQV